MEICPQAGFQIRPYNYLERNSEAVAYRKIEKIEKKLKYVKILRQF